MKLNVVWSTLPLVPVGTNILLMHVGPSVVIKIEGVPGDAAELMTPEFRTVVSNGTTEINVKGWYLLENQVGKCWSLAEVRVR
jgi:hypothetical protein